MELVVEFALRRGSWLHKRRVCTYVRDPGPEPCLARGVELQCPGHRQYGGMSLHQHRSLEDSGYLIHM